MNLWRKFLDILYPENNFCLVCGKNYLCSELRYICDSCLPKLEFLEHYCQICGREIAATEELCHFCQKEFFAFDLARSVGIYDGLLKEMIQKFKYEHLLKIGEPLAQLLSLNLDIIYNSEKNNKIGKTNENDKIDKIIPVPIHDNRFLKRGYNQAFLLAKNLSKESGIPLSKAVERVKDSPPLYNFAFEERRDLLKNSFTCEKGYFKGQILLLVDDIFTTGATANEISKVLKEIGGAKRVFVLTVATARTY